MREDPKRGSELNQNCDENRRRKNLRRMEREKRKKAKLFKSRFVGGGSFLLNCCIQPIQIGSKLSGMAKGEKRKKEKRKKKL